MRLERPPQGLIPKGGTRLCDDQAHSYRILQGAKSIYGSDFLALLGGDRINLPKYFRPVYVVTEIWQSVGWGSIIYLAAVSAIDQELYASASINGAGRLRQAWHVTIPGILPTIVILLILRMGNMMSIGFEKIFLLYNPAIYETADVIPTFVYAIACVLYRPAGRYHHSNERQRT